MISDKTRNMAIKTISLFIFGLFAVIAYAYFHELSHYIAAKLLSVPNPQMHYASVTMDLKPGNITRANIIGNESIVLTGGLIAFPGIIYTILISTVCSWMLIRKNNLYVLLISFLSLEASFISLTSIISIITMSSDIGTPDLASTIMSVVYFTHWYNYDMIFSWFIVLLNYLEILITFYPVIVYLKNSGFAVEKFVQFPHVLFYPIIIIYVAVTYMLRAGITNMELFNKYYTHYCTIVFLAASVYFWINIYGLYLGPMILP